MATKKKEQLEISMTPDDWKKWKTLTNKSACRYLKDPSEVFLLGLKSACNLHN